MTFFYKKLKSLGKIICTSVEYKLDDVFLFLTFLLMIDDGMVFGINGKRIRVRRCLGLACEDLRNIGLTQYCILEGLNLMHVHLVKFLSVSYLSCWSLFFLDRLRVTIIWWTLVWAHSITNTNTISRNVSSLGNCMWL